MTTEKEILEQKLKDINTILDELFVSIEVIENSNKLIYDKIDDIDVISKKKNTTTQQRALDYFDIERNIECFLTLSYLISRELEAMQDKIQNIYNETTAIKEELNARVTPEERKEDKKWK